MADVLKYEDFEQLFRDATAMKNVVNGAENEDVTTRLGKVYPTFAKALKIMQQAGGAKAYKTLDEAKTDIKNLVANTPVYISSDTTNKNGLYLYDGQTLLPSEYDPLKQANEYTESGLTQKLDRNIVQQSEGDILIALTDALRNRTWLEANATDGGPTQFSLDHLFNIFGAELTAKTAPGYLLAFTDKLGMLTDLALDESGRLHKTVVDRIAIQSGDSFGLHLIANNQYAFAVSDQNGVLTDLAVDQSGRIPDVILQSWKDRMGIDSTSVQKKPSKDYLEVNGTQRPLFPDMTKFAIWGSSVTDCLKWSPRPMWDIIPKYFGVSDIYYGGKWGETADQISSRIGAKPAMIKPVGGSIPSSGSVDVETDYPNYNRDFLQPFKGTLSGVRGELSYSNDSTTKFKFTRESAGEATSVVQSLPFMPDAVSYKDAVVVMNVGKNGIVSGGETAKYVYERNVEIIEFLAPVCKRLIIVGQFVNTDDNSSSQRSELLSCNKLLKERYPAWFFDIQEYITSNQVWSDTGITPTDTDIAQQKAGTKPKSLSSDGGHFNDAGNLAVANYVLKLIKNLNWY